MAIKVFVDGRVFDQPPHGSAIFIYNIYRHILTSGKKVKLLIGVNTNNIYSHYPDLCNSPLVSIHRYRSKHLIILLFVEIPKIIKNNFVSVAHFQYIVPLRKACKYIVTTHDILYYRYPQDYSLSHRLPRKVLFKLSAHIADIVTTVSNFSKIDIVKYFHVPENKIVLTPNAPPDSEFSEKSVSKSWVQNEYGCADYLLYVSRIEPRKNHINLVKAFFELELDKLGMQLVFVGETTVEVTELDRYIDKLGPRNSAIVVLSNIRTDSLNHIYNAARIAVYPSLSEGFGIPPLESACALVPTICSNTTAMAEFTFFGENHIDPSDMGALKDAIRRNIDYPPSLDELKVIKRNVKEKYCWGKTARTIESLFEELSNDKL